MVKFENKQITIDGKSIFLLSGEVHYFRQPRERWQQIIDEAKDMGLNCIATYVPWICHEEVEGEYCFEGNLDVGAFIDLCSENDLYVFMRPGPFIMAEVKKEGIPYWVGKKHPEALPIGFDGEQRKCNMIDYLHPGYLEECRKWYKEIMSIIAPRLHCNGGKVIGVQLDNEIGMLNWVTNYPTLNDNVLTKFVAYLENAYTQKELEERYPFEVVAEKEVYHKFRSPEESYTAPFHFDFGRFLRNYYAEYVKLLKQYAEESGIHDTPFFINIHGTGSGRMYDFPLGISQLYEAFNQEEGMISGTDVYLGEPTEGNYQDLYAINALTDCMNQKGNPLTSIEFECSDGHYCSLDGIRFHPSATSQKMLMCLSQNARMLSFYVFAGGENYILNHPEKDGNERIAFTGELHGYNAPLQPDNTHNYSFEHIKTTAKAIHALNHLIAESTQKIDDISLAYIPDYFLTEATYNKSKKITAIHENLQKWRGQYSLDSVARGLLGHQIHFDAVDIQHDDFNHVKNLVVLSARYMSGDIQQKLVTYMEEGGNVLFYGELPEYDLEGNSCTYLLDTMNLKKPEYLVNDQPSYFITFKGVEEFEGITVEQRGKNAQCFTRDKDAILVAHGEDTMCGMIKTIGKGKAYIISCDYPADFKFYKHLLEVMNIHGSVEAEHYRKGIYLARTTSKDKQQLLYLMNLDAVDKTIDLKVDGEILFEEFKLKDKDSYILPLNVDVEGVKIVKSTAELVGFTRQSLSFRLSQPKDRIIIRTSKKVVPSENYEVVEDGMDKLVISKKHSVIDDQLIIYLEDTKGL